MFPISETTGSGFNVPDIGNVSEIRNRDFKFPDVSEFGNVSDIGTDPN
jgi:hypothetical protein